MQCLRWIILLVVASLTGRLDAALEVVTTTPTLADITRQVGGEHVSVQSIMRGPENVHNVKPKPSFVMKLRRADLFVHSGLDAEPWVPQVVKSCRRRDLLPGEPGNVDASPGIELKEVPGRGELTRAEGDIHAFGNTHYLLDPLNGIIAGRTIMRALQRADPAHGDDYAAGFEAFEARVLETVERLAERMAPFKGAPVATYHRSWPYFLDRFGLVTVAEVEPKPGIPPGPRHLAETVEAMRARGARVVIVETFNPYSNADNVAERAGGRAVVLAHEVGALPGTDSYEALFEHDVGLLIEAFEATGGVPAPGESQP